MHSKRPLLNVSLRPVLVQSLGLLLGLLVLLELTGCGFKLRGSDNTQYSLPPIFLTGAQSSDVFQAVYKGMLRKRIDLVISAEQAGLIVELGPGRRDRQPLSVDAQGRVQEYVLQYAVLFSVRDTSGRRLIDHEQITLTRNYLYSELDVLAKANEEQQLYQAMQRELVERIVYRLQAVHYIDSPAEDATGEPGSDRLNDLPISDPPVSNPSAQPQ